MRHKKSNPEKSAEKTPRTDEKVVRAKPIEVVSLDIGEEGEETAVFSAETTRDLLQEAQEERYAEEVAHYTDDEEIEESLTERQQLNHGSRSLIEKLQEHHAESPDLSAGDVDAAWYQADVAGEETVGGLAVTPDQDSVEAIGDALGITYEDDEPLHTAEKLAQRDKKRWELDIDSNDDNV